MSDATRRMRETVGVLYESTVANHAALRELRDRAADAIKAVEAQVAEAVARVAALEKRQGVDETRSGGPLVGHAQPETPRASKDGKTVPAGSAPAPAAPTAVPASDLWHRATQGFVSSTLPTDMWPHDPAPSAVPAPRGFKRGDVVRHCDHPSEDWTVEEADTGGVWCAHVGGLYYADPEFLTLVRAAAAPEAPADEDTGLVVQRIRDEATKPLHVEIEKLRGEVARLTAERDDWKYAAEVQKKDTEGWKARAEAADIRADGHAEGLRSICKMLTQSPPDVDRAILWCDDSLSGYTQSVAATEAETNDRALAAEARAEAAEKALADANDRLTSQSRSIEEMHAEVRRLRKIVRAMVKWHRVMCLPRNCVCVWCEEFGPEKKRAALRGRRGR